VDRHHRRKRCAAGVINGVRTGTVPATDGSVLRTVAFHTDTDGTLLDARTAAAELLNVLRPVVAVDCFIAFVAVALQQHSQWRERVAAHQADLDTFVQEVRRHHPFSRRGRRCLIGCWNPCATAGKNPRPLHGPRWSPEALIAIRRVASGAAGRACKRLTDHHEAGSTRTHQRVPLPTPRNACRSHRHHAAMTLPLFRCRDGLNVPWMNLGSPEPDKARLIPVIPAPLPLVAPSRSGSRRVSVRGLTMEVSGTRLPRPVRVRVVFHPAGGMRGDRWTTRTSPALAVGVQRGRSRRRWWLHTPGGC
jgi:hypothetical protein